MEKKQPDWVDSARKQRELDHIIVYGEIRPKSDKRCFRRELLDELLDSLNYCQYGFQKGELTKRQFKHIDSTIRAVIRTLEYACNDKFQWEMGWIE